MLRFPYLLCSFTQLTVELVYCFALGFLLESVHISVSIMEGEEERKPDIVR